MQMNNFIIDHVLRGNFFDSKGNVIFSLSQIQNPQLNVSSDSTDAVDALGVPITTFYRAKNAELSCENAIFDMSLLAAQSGSVKKEAASDAKITVPCFETLNASSTALQHEPKTMPEVAYVLNSDSTLGEQVMVGTGEDKLAISGKALTMPTTGLAEGYELYIMYEYEADGTDKNGAVSVVNTANEFPKAGQLVLEVLGCDVCKPEEQIFAYVVFPNFKLSPDFDWTMSTDSTHAFSGKAQQEYCSREKKLFEVIIPE